MMKNNSNNKPYRLCLTLLVGLVNLAFAGTQTDTLRISKHYFHPDTLIIPADTKVKLIVINEDATPEEFESHELNREKIIPGNSQGVVFIGPLDPGIYPFFGEFNEATAQGAVKVK